MRGKGPRNRSFFFCARIFVMAYTTRDKVEKYLNTDLSSVSGAVTDWIAWITAWINKYCGRTFETASADKYYDGNGKDRILVDSFVGVPTTVAILNSDGTVRFTLTEGADNDYVAYPLNSTEKNEIVLMPNSPIRAFSRAFFEDILDDTDINDPGFTERRVLKVTAAFGASTSVPADIEMIATKLVGQIAQKRLKGAEGSVLGEALGDYSIRYGEIDENADALGVYQVLDQWREPTI